MRRLLPLLLLLVAAASAHAQEAEAEAELAMQSRAVDTRVTLTVAEGVPAGTLVGAIPTKPGFSYRFNEAPREFSLDARSGAIRTAADLDREALRSDRFDLVVLSSQPTYPIEVRITVLDVNDNAPAFPEASIAVAFSESAAPGTRLLLDAAADADAGANGVADDYRIVAGNADDKFRLVATESPAAPYTYLHLETTARLDREQVPHYQLNVSARDGGDPPRYGFLLVNVTVLDVNDNPPIFDHSDYTVSLNESAPPGTHVLQVTATDSDVGDNARIAYYLSDGERQFAVDAETGAISTAEPLSCPQQSCAQQAGAGAGLGPAHCPKSCVFTVFARDHGSPRQDGRTYVTVNLVDANDHDPVIKFRYFPSTSGFATVDENAANGSVVAAVSVVDQDEGPNGETTVEIRAGNELGHFRLDCTPSFDIVRVHGVLDREQVSKYNLTVVAADRGSPPRTATAFLIVHVNDVNDHEPVFAKSEYSAVLSELAPAGSYVASIAAADEDSGVNARIYYAFVSGNERGWFHIDEDSGLVTTRAPLDREAQDTAELRVSARDGGPNPKWAYTQLKVAVLDENDERPRFSQERIEVSLPESAPAGTLVAMLTAEDADQGTNGSVAYELPRPADYPGAFSLDALTGQLTTRRPLDRERLARYEVRVVARDRGVAAPALSASATVVLTVQDENDNSPAFYPAHYFAAVPQHTPVGATILQVSATDADEGVNAEVRYALEAGDAALFAVEARTGAVTLRAPLPAGEEEGGVWRLRVSARDAGGRRAEPDATVELLPRERLTAIEFDSAAGYHFQIAEDDGSAAAAAAGGRVVGRVRARRAQAVTYAVVAGDPDGSFQVDAASGVISTRAALDRETVARYSLRVLARAGLAAGEAVVNITVLDLNDNAPEFPGVPAEVRLAENAAVGQQVCLCRAVDRDAAANGRLAYSVPAGEAQFGVSAASGVLFLRRPVRAPPGSRLTVEVAATDAGSPPRTATHALSVLVEDVNDHTPVFDHTSYETSLLESTPVNERFFALAASDADLGANGQVRYAISEGDAAGRFGVFPDGWLYVRSALDREQRDYYSLLVTASDGGDPPRSSQVPVTVHVVDENDNAPQFANATFQFRVRENEPPDSFVGKLSAWDRDVGRNAELTFALAGGGERRDFTVDPKNGFVKTLHVFDREQLVRDTGQSYVLLEATVTDNGAAPLADRAKVYVHVADENDNAPRFLRTPYRVQVSEAASVGTQVFRVFTADADEGANGQVEYSLVGGNEAGRFAVDAGTGVVTVAAALDREAAPAYALLVEARDRAPHPARRLSATATLAVDVLDENDNAPRFTAPLLPRVSVAETTPVGTELARFAAADADAGVNAEVSFSLAGGNRRDAFAMDAATGALYLHRPLDYEELAAYALNVTAADGGTPRLATSLLFRVDVEDSNDNPPAFPNTAIVRQIREGIPQRTPIVTVAAEDPDSGANGQVVYRIGRQEPPGPDHFGIDPATGVIHTLLPVDREAVDTFRLTVVATDRAEPESARLSAEKLVTVIVEDVNDNAPQFVSMNAAVLPAAARDGTGASDVPVAVVRARDLDSGTNGLVTYDLVSGGGELFRLDRNSGLLTVRRGAALPEPRYHLAVKASDEAVQAERKSSDAYMTILAAPADEARAPHFEQAAAGSVYENEPAGTSVLTLRAAAAQPQAAVEYYVTNVTWAGGRQADRLFDVDARLGVLSTAVPLDREAGPPHYLVTVVAVVVAGAPPALATTTVRVSVLDRNDSPPSLSASSPRELSVSEELPPGPAPVATLVAQDPDLEGAVRFSLLPSPGAGNSSAGSGSGSERFALDAVSGALTLRAPLDREAAAKYLLTVRLSDGLQHSDTDITVHVTDANDNPPVFGEAAYSFDIVESAARGARVGEVSARDLDEGVNGVLSYSVASDWANDVFSLHPQTGVFTLTARLDYEEVAHYIFVVEAQDAGRPSLSSTVSVYFNVLDLNDNAPLFDPMSYSNEVLENVTVGSPVLTVSATDLDSGENGRIEYSISAGDAEGAFAITDNGTVVTARPLDREARPLYNLVVTAADCGQPRLSSTVQVTVVLKDVNDAAPEFISPGEVSVAENTPAGTVVLAVKAVDRDEGRNGYVEYSLVTANSSASDADAHRLFSVGATDGLVRVTGRLDRETRAQYQLWVEARDRGQPPLATRAPLRVRVLDENDNSPVFDPRQYSASVAENASIGASVLQVSATDVDEGGNGVVRYAIVSGDENRDLSISEDTGVVRVAGTLNFERAPRYVLTVRASDSGRPPRHDQATVAVQVADINDNPPVFLDSPYLAYVMENVVPPAGGGYVVTVRAHDADSPPHNAQVRYFLKEGDGDVFRVNATSGEVRVLRPLDREARSHYLLTLVAMDTGTPPLTGTGTVRVEVQDVNDHAPEFARQAYEATVAENLPAGAAVVRAQAADSDEGDNARLRYSLLGEHAARFHVHPDTGLVTTAASLDREEASVYQLTLVAQDCSPTEPRAAAVNVTVTVADANDNAPVFSAPKYTVYVPDSTKPGDFVFGAEAEDLDAGANGQVRFSLSGPGASSLSVEAETGVVRASAALPAAGEVRATVTATDGGREARAAAAELVVRTRPRALFPALSLSLPQGQGRATLPEDAPAGMPVARLSASSPKAGPAAHISYAVAGGNRGAALRVDANSGEVVVAGGGLDYEIAASFSVWLEARDNDSPPLRSVVRLDVTVRDANDNAPVPERAVYSAEVPEEQLPPVLVCRVHADDADTGVNGEVSYRLRPTDSSALFSVDAVTGEVWTRARLDREQTASHRLLVEAVDGGSPALSGTTTVLVTVRDVNDNPPRFTRLFSVNVTENAELGSFVIRVTSSDRDVGENANASYSFADNPGERFAIDPVTGNVTVAGLLDREAQDEYLLKVAAVDGSWRAETPITVTVQDQNDNAPEFEHSYYSFSVPETTTGGSTEGDAGSEVGAAGRGQPRRQSEAVFVGRVVATDRDKQGPNSVISYALQQPSDLFTVDPASGDIFSKRRLRYKHSASLDRSPENQYSFTVTATDNGKPPMSSECLVTVDVVDANNNSPEFEADRYFSPVPEKASVGLQIIKVTAHDDLDVGVNAEVEYVKTGAGNGSQFFQVARDTGWISVARALGDAGVTYTLGVRARDHGVPPRHADVTVTLVVTTDNRHSPVFNTLSYQVIVPENEPVGSTIVTLSATDGDEGPNGMVRYSIASGSECEEFAVSAETGAVTIRRPLDYDSVPEYHLNITASDLAFEPRHATATLRVTLTDVNDNAPTFEHTEYSASVRENAPAGTAVFTLLAHDADSARYAVVRYSLVGGSGRDAFRLDPETGVLYSRQPFDYEQTQLYTLDVLAANPDSPMYGSTKVVVHVTGENEFYPHFVQPVFHLDVSESAEVGTSVGTVRATDEDAGDDGHVFYLFVGASNDRGFSIVAATGEIRVARRLDRETQSRAVLTVLAKNRGSIRGNDTDEAQVIISIQDGNDPPEFEQEVYEAEVSEGAAPGALVATVRATDSDVRPHNNHFSYSIIAGNAQHAFKVDPATGVVETTSRLDREVTPAYSLVVGAIDTGTPPQTGTATLRVRVSDVNDNGPQLAPDASRGYVSENEPAGTSVMTLTATDPDLPPNGAPFAYNIVGGRHRDLVSVERHSGLVRTTRPLDREVTPELEIIVEVEDSGEPPMRSQLPVTVTVLDQNDSPSTPRAVHVLVYAFEGQLPHGKIADVRPNDPDTTGDYHCEVQSGGGGLTIPAGTCELHALPSLSQSLTTGTATGRGLALAVAGNDGVHADVVSAVTVELAAFDKAAVVNAVPLRAENTTAERFLAAHYKAAVDALRAAFPAPADAPLLFGLRQVDTGLEMAVAVHSQQGYRDKALVSEALSRTAPLLPALSVAYSACRQRAPCQNGASCSEALRVRPNRTLVLDSRTLIFATPAVVLEVECQCTEGFAGERCDRRQDPCSPSPCLSGGTCHRGARLGDFSCSCPPLREGRLCELERGAVCSTHPCLNGGSCRESSDGASFFCLCRPGFRGNRCEAAADSCRPNPCAHGGVCVALPPPPALGYRCSCPDGRFGRHCEGSAFGFGELAFAAFPSLDATTNDVSVVFATTKPDALLVYNYGAQTGGRSDFVSLELVDGRATFSYGGARTAIASVQAGGELADGHWHRVTATRNGRVLSLSVASCGEDGDACRDCRPGDRSCSADEFGPTGTLNFDGSPMLVGGLPSVEAVLERPGQVHSDELVGCVHSVTVNGRALNLSSPLRARAVSPTCSRPRLSSCDSSDADSADRERCGPAGRCAEAWPSRRCECHTGSAGPSPEWVLSPDCGPALAPVSLGAGARLDLSPGERHRRLQLLDALYRGTTRWRRPPAPAASAEQHRPADRAVAFAFRTLRTDAALFFAASNSDFTSIELRGGQLVYVSRLGGAPAVNTSAAGPPLSDGAWHHVRLSTQRRALSLLLDGARAGDELDAAGVHDFLDPDLTALSLGSAPPHLLPGAPDFEGCLANFTINDELQPLNGSGSILPDVVWHGAVTPGCAGPAGLAATATPDPLSIGITLVIVFFVVLLVAILVSFVVFRLRRQKKEKGGGVSGGGIVGKQNGGATLVSGGGGPGGGGNDGSGGGCGVLGGRGLSAAETAAFLGETGDVLRPHHLVGPELIAKKYKEREIVAQRPDIIEREVVGKPLQPPLQPPQLTAPSSAPAPQPTSASVGPNDPDLPEHYDLENASSIAPSDIDIVYHYKGYREGGNVRKYRATPPHLPPPTVVLSATGVGYHHKHSASGSAAAQQQQHRHSPRGGFAPPQRDSPRQAAPPPPADSSPGGAGPGPGSVAAGSGAGGGPVLQSTPLARLSPSSELSAQQAPRILTLQDISGKPLQSALLATTSSSGGVGKDVLHSNSERSLNSPVMSQLSGQSSSASRKVSAVVGGSGVVGTGAGSVGSGAVVPGGGPVPEVGLTAEEIERLNSRPRTSSLVSTLDAVSSSSEAARGPSGPGGVGGATALHRKEPLHLHHGVGGAVNGGGGPGVVGSPAQHGCNTDDNASSTTTDESGNDSFTCSEFEYDNTNEKTRGAGEVSAAGGDQGKPPLPPVPPASYDGFDSSFRGSLSTLVASDDDLSTHVGASLYRAHNGSPSSTAAALGWDYLLNWGPNFESLVGVFKDIAELPDSVNSRVAASLRLPNSAPKPSEEYV